MIDCRCIKNHVLWIGIAFAAMAGLCFSVAAPAQPAPDADERPVGARTIMSATQDRRVILEPRYGFAEWKGKDSRPLDLSRISFGSVQAGESVFRLGMFSDSVNATKSPLLGTRAGVAGPLRMEMDSGIVSNACSVSFILRVYESALVAQDALMYHFAHPLRTRPEEPGDGPAYGETVLDGIGDVCFGHCSIDRCGIIECVVSNVWFSLRGNDLSGCDPAAKPRPESIAAALVELLRDADTKNRERAPDDAGRLQMRTMRMTDQGMVEDKSVPPLDTVRVKDNEGVLVRLALRPHPDAGEPVRQSVAASRGVQTDDGLRRKRIEGLFRFDASDKGEQKALFVTQYADGSIGVEWKSFEVE